MTDQPVRLASYAGRWLVSKNLRTGTTPEGQGSSLFPPPPSLLYTNDGEWAYYIHGHDLDGLWQVDDPDVLQYESLWLRPVTSASVDESERPEDHETITRGPDGRFQSTYVWFECRESDHGAEPYLGVKYAPV